MSNGHELWVVDAGLRRLGEGLPIVGLPASHAWRERDGGTMQAPPPGAVAVLADRVVADQVAAGQVAAANAATGPAASQIPLVEHPRAATTSGEAA